MKVNKHYFETNYAIVIFLIVSLGLIVRIISSLYFHSTVFNGIGPASADGLRYHLLALDINEISFSYDYLFTSFLPVIGYLYSVLLAVLYKIFYPSILVAYFFSIFIWLLTCIIFWFTSKELKIKKNFIILIFLLYTFFPSSIFFSSVTLKEIYQLLFFSSSIYFLIRMEKEINFENYIMFIISIILLSISHRYLFVMSFVLLYLSVIQLMKIKIYQKTFLFTSSSIIIFLLFFSYFILNINITGEINEFRTNQHISRASYDFSIVEGISNEKTIFFYEMILSIIYYFIKPFVFDIQGAGDLILFFENMIRFYFIIHGTFLIFKSFKLQNLNSTSITVFLIIILMELFWAVGTTNYGTAVRHHFVALPLLFISYFSLLSNDK